MKTVRIYCNRCRVQTPHTEYGKAKTASPDDVWSEHYEEVPPDGRRELRQILIHGTTQFTRLMLCSVCNSPTMEIRYRHEGEAFRDSKGNHFIHWDEPSYQPPREEGYLSLDSFDIPQLQQEVSECFKEALFAWNRRALTTSAVLLRALVEKACKDEGIKGNLEEKIDELPVPDGLKTSLHGIRYLGNDAAHELIRPDESTAREALDLVASLLQMIYQRGGSLYSFGEQRLQKARSRRNSRKSSTDK